MQDIESLLRKDNLLIAVNILILISMGIIVIHSKSVGFRQQFFSGSWRGSK